MTVAGARLEVRRIAGDAARPVLVFLHEGLGSVSAWRDFPATVAAATGCPALVYSRRGYGRSDPLAGPRAPDYMHDEARAVLPALLAGLGIENPVLVGHSDGASIALIHAGDGRGVRGLALLAPHVFVEDISIAGIEAAREAYRTTDLRARLARHHADVDGAFRGWNDIWLAPEFRAWNIEASLPAIACPVLAVQGADDAYGTMAQIEAIRRRIAGPCAVVALDACGHSPQRDQPEKTRDALVRFVARVVG